MIKNMWNSVMDADKNPLMSLPKMVRFQMMTYLAIMWCMVFTVWTGWLMTLGPSIFAHMLFLVGIFFTDRIFRNARKKTHRDMYKDKDGGVKYDDIWGGT